MAKDTEKLIRQLSLVSYLMAERRPVTALEIRRDVEGYSGMNEDAFARRFYADRSELDALGIQLAVDRPSEGAAEQENYSLRPENFHLPPIEFTDKELAALRTALTLLDGQFAYAEPLRLALQQITWGRPSPLQAPDQNTVALAITADAGGNELSARLAKVETAIFRNKTIDFEYYTIERDELSTRRVDPYHLLYKGSQFYLLGYAHERKAVRVFRLSRMRGKVSYASKAEHDFHRPRDFDPREYAARADWQLGERRDVAEVQLSDRIAWLIGRHFGAYGEMREGDDGSVIFSTAYSSARGVISWVLGLGQNARLLGPEELVEGMQRRLELIERRHGDAPPRRRRRAVAAEEPPRQRITRPRTRRSEEDEDGRPSVAIRSERFARLVTLACMLIAAGREGERIAMARVCAELKISDEELREDVNVLNVVNFGGGSYVLYAEIDEASAEIEVDPEPYSDNFDRPARLLPVEAKALVAAIDLIGEHIPEGSLTSARHKIVAALGSDPMDQGLQVVQAIGDDTDVSRVVSKAIVGRRLLEMEYYKENEDELSLRRVEPYALMNGREGWYLAAFDPDRDDVRHFRLDRIKTAAVSDEKFRPRPEIDPAADIDGWLRTGEVAASRTARVWISPERARWARESRRVVEEWSDGSVIVELSFAGTDWLVREILKEAGDAAVLEPEQARAAVHETVLALLDPAAA